MTQLPPPAGRQSERDRRVYFERLTQALLGKGIDGDSIGQIVAELDEHVRLTGGDPVDELGPVSELSEALAEATSGRKPRLWLTANALLGVAAGLAAASIGALLVTQPDGSRVIPVGIAIYIGVFTFALVLLRAIHARRRVGRPRFEPAVVVPAVVFAAVVGVIGVLVAEVEVPISLAAATGLALVSVPATVLLARWSSKRSRVAVPGHARHLHRLDLGFWSR